MKIVTYFVLLSPLAIEAFFSLQYMSMPSDAQYIDRLQVALSRALQDFQQGVGIEVNRRRRSTEYQPACLLK